MKIKTSPAKPHSYWTFCERHMKRIFWLFGNGARTLTACRKLVETARRCEGVYKRQESRARLFAKEEEQRHECAPIFIQKSEQAIQSLLRRGGEGGIRTHVPGNSRPTAFRVLSGACTKRSVLCMFQSVPSSPQSRMNTDFFTKKPEKPSNFRRVRIRPKNRKNPHFWKELRKERKKLRTSRQYTDSHTGK